MDARQESVNSDDMLPVSAQGIDQYSEQAVHQANNENDTVPIELTNATGTYLHHLNEDCLLKIFEVASLTLMDLCSIAQTCRSFQRITQRVSLKYLRIQSWSKRKYDVDSRKYLRNTGRSSQDVETICKRFGSCLCEVFIHGHYGGKSHFLVNLVTENCLDSLHSLRIERMDIPALLSGKLRPIFKRLQILDLAGVSIVGYDQTQFADLDSLIELRVRRVDNDRAILDNIFTKLKRFTYKGDKFRIDHPLLTFISRHRSLKMLDVHVHTCDDMFKMNFLQLIGNSCMDLEVLDLNVGPTNASSLQPLLQALQSLKTLKLWKVSFDDFNFIPAMTKLRELYLIDCLLPKDSNQFSGMAQLTKLDLKGVTLAKGQLIIQIGQLTKNFKNCKFRIDGVTYSLWAKLAIRKLLEEFQKPCLVKERYIGFRKGCFQENRYWNHHGCFRGCCL